MCLMHAIPPTYTYVLLYPMQEAVLDDLDPFTDSVELEFGIETTDRHKGLRHRSRPARPRTQMPHPLAQHSVSAPMTSHTPQPQPQPPPQTDTGRRSPPPPYDAVLAQGTPVTYGTAHLYPDLSEDLHQTVPRSSSTPSVDGQQ